MNGELLWARTQNNDIAPPIPKKMSGRPKRKRKREPSEGLGSQKGRTTISRKGRVMSCSICKQAGHNKAKCPNKTSDTHETSTEPAKTTRTVKEASANLKKKRRTETKAPKTPPDVGPSSAAL
ncbi:unnamed protein product [Cuscuta europaea]|uniref:Uncharacterized protein n=1 Tax=Cuscuta europaea TaxID=41803 RepID=A0A9P1EI33_CUSEU|nr:unnamed protein product [Cuscuta europaea]